MACGSDEPTPIPYYGVGGPAESGAIKKGVRHVGPLSKEERVHRD
jgi:hypothetical protein